MRVFITGASGFIGSHVCRALVNAQHEVMTRTSSDNNLWRIQDILPNIKVLRGSFQDASSLQEELQSWRPEVCIHLGWYAEHGKYLTGRENLDSLQRSLTLLQVLSNCGCQHFIGAGTCFEYAMKSESLSETDPTKPETLYAASKLSFQMLGHQLAAQTGMRFTWGRIFYLYGMHEDFRRLVPSAILTLQKGETFFSSPGEQIRDYLHVTDVANAFLVLMEQQAAGVYNICSARPITIKSLLDMIGHGIGRPGLLAHGKLPYREWDPMYICGKNDRLQAIGWTPKIDLYSGLQQTIGWWKQEEENNTATSRKIG